MSPGEQGFWIESGSNGVAIEGSSCDGLLGLQSTGGRVKMDKNHPDRFIVVAWSIRVGVRDEGWRGVGSPLVLESRK